MSRPTVAVVGASRQRSKYGNKCVRAFRDRGYEVFPINPSADEVEGLPALASLADLPVEPDRISLYLPPDQTRELIPQLARFPAAQVWFNPGCADTEILAAAAAAGIDVHDGCSIVALGLSPAQYP